MHSIGYDELFTSHSLPNSFIKEIINFCSIEIYFSYSVNLDIIKLLLHNLIYLLIFIAGTVPMCKKLKLFKELKYKFCLMLQSIKTRRDNVSKTQVVDCLNSINIKIKYLYVSEIVLGLHSLVCLSVNIISPFIYNENKQWRYSLISKCCLIQISLLFLTLMFCLVYRAKPLPSSFNKSLEELFLMTEQASYNYRPYVFKINNYSSSNSLKDKSLYKRIKPPNKKTKENNSSLFVILQPFSQLNNKQINSSNVQDVKNKTTTTDDSSETIDVLSNENTSIFSWESNNSKIINSMFDKFYIGICT